LQTKSEDNSQSQRGDPRGDYQAARLSAAGFDLSDTVHLRLTGRDQAKFLNNFCTNDIRALGTGDGCEAFVTNVQGKVLAHIFVYASADSLWVVSVPGSAESLISHLSRYQISEDVSFADLTAEFDTLAVVGPQAPDIVSLEFPQAANLASPRMVDMTFEDTNIQIRRNDFLRLPCLVLVVPKRATHRLKSVLRGAGVRPAGEPAFEALRIEAGFPRYGVDITDSNLAQEVGRTSRAISFAKGCYLGQEPIARIDALGHVNQQLRGIRMLSGPLPPAGSEVVLIGDEPRPIGRVTSSAISYADDRPVALAYIRRGFELPGQAVGVRIDQTIVPGLVYWPSD
jgi:tRNA-modifying protein YgfZ